MPVDLALTVMTHNEGMTSKLKSMLNDVRSGNVLNINCQEIDYNTGWAEFMRIAIHGGNLDVSEIGSTWISDFIAMNALRPFSPADIRELGGEEAFPPGQWRSGLGEHGVAWAIPWMTDLSMVYYRRNLLQKAGVDETDAFSTPEKFEQTLARLSQSGVASPWVVPTRHTYITLHNLSMWLWSQDADFVDRTSKKVLLNEPNARAALRSYFDLSRYLSTEARGLSETESDSLFHTGKAAVTISGPWLYPFCELNKLEDVGLAVPFGLAYLGGSSLVIWNSSRSWGEASKLISFLTSQEAQMTLPKAAGLLPARVNVLERFSFTAKQDLNRIILQGLKNGRSFPLLPLWGMIEDRLANVLENLWSQLLSDSNADLDNLLDQKLPPEVNRLNIALSG